MTIQTMARNQVEDDIGSGAGEAPDPLAALLTEHRLDLAWIVLQTWDDLPAVAARCAPTRLMTVCHHHVDAGLREMQGRREPQVTGTDDQHLRAVRTFELRHRGCRNCGFLPDVGMQRVAQRVHGS